MLIKIDNSLLECVGANDPLILDRLRLCITHLLNAHREGRHFLLIDRDLSRSLKAMPGLSIDSISMLKRLGQSSTQYMNITSMVNTYCLVVNSDFFSASVDGLGSKVIRVPFAAMANSCLSRETKFVAENLVDIEFYTKIALASFLPLGIRGLNIKFEPDMGGGSFTSVVYEKNQIQNRFCFCVVDSDKYCPASCSGDTSQRLSRTNSTDSFLSDFCVIDTRTIENLIPDNLIKLLSPDRLSVYAGLIDRFPFLRWHLHLREGLRLKDVIKGRIITQCDELKEFILNDLFHGSNPCLNSDSCLEPSDCECIVFRGFGPAMLKECLKEMERTSNHKLFEMLSDSLREKWLRLGLSLISWGIAPKPTVT
jgi:hypothetical protein